MILLLSTGALFSPIGSADAGEDAAQEAADFDAAVAPIFVRHCVTCHNASDPKGGLDLTQQAGVLRGGDSGGVIDPGKPDESYLLERVAEGSMPPEGQGVRLSREEVATLSQWIASGAEWPQGRVLNPFERTTDVRAGWDWWSLQPVVRPDVPEVERADWVRNPIDAFIMRRLEAEGLEPAPEADRVTLLRRAKFDLLGLPPTPDEIDEFVNDSSPRAYARLIDRLLASPHYGERWARHWLDVVRYGESDGFEHDKLRPRAWRYRDYVIRSFNNDKPYAQFVREQLAGDALQPLTRDGLVATGFLVAGPWDEIQNVGASKPEMMRAHEEQIAELIGAVGQTFLGMTVHCARCHDHKFDPIPQTDYYRLKAVFDGVDHGNMSILTPAERKAREAELAPIRARIAELEKQLRAVDSQMAADAAAESTSDGVLVEGRFGRAVDARHARVTAPHKPVWHRPPFTVECWAKLDSRSRFNILVADSPKGSSHHWEIYTYVTTGEFSAYLPGYEPAEIKSGVDITDGRWHYTAMTFDGRRVSLFVDGRLVKAVDVTRQREGGPTGPLSIGSFPPQNIGCDGVVDEVRISNSVRSIDGCPDEPFIADDHTTGLWHLDKLEGDRFRDASRPVGDESSAEFEKQRTALAEALKQAQDQLAAHPEPLAYSGVRKQPGPTQVLLRGDIAAPGPQVTAAGLSSVKALPPDFGLPRDAPEAERRVAFADWVADPRNPLTARVLVNRLWHYHFGQGLVKTPSDFGFNGGRPSHPELLDWLASEFLACGGSIKEMHRRIMLSAAYRQSSQFNPRAAEFDSDNRLLWRFTPRRLEGEIVRDAMLAVSGELNPVVGGPSFQPFTVTVFNTHFYHLFDKDDPQYNRRTVYRINVNTGRDPLLDALDCPTPSIAMPQRRTTTTPLQALSLMNDSFVVRQARRFAQRVERLAGPALADQVELAYQIAFGRPPNPEERRASAAMAQTHGLDNVCWVLINASEFLYVK